MTAEEAWGMSLRAAVDPIHTPDLKTCNVTNCPTLAKLATGQTIVRGKA